MPSLKLGVFWDYENIRVPSGFGADVASNLIRKALTGLAIDGVSNVVIVERRLYFDSRALVESQTNRTILDLSGFTLVDCPTRNKKETLDKKIIVDIMFSATTFHSESGDRYGVALLSSDGDYAYMLNRVRDLGVFVVLIHAGLAGQPPITPSFLLNSADVVLHWRMDVLAEQLAPTLPHSVLPNSGLLSSGLASKAPALLDAAAPAFDAQSSSWVGRSDLNDLDDAMAPTDFGPAPEQPVPEAEPLAETDPADGFFDLLLTIICDLVARSPSGWAAHALVSHRFYQARGTRNNEQVRVLASACNERGLIRWGRRRLSDGVIIHVPEQGCKNDQLSAEVYVQLTSVGNGILHR